MKNSKMLAIIVFVTGISILGVETSSLGIIDSVLAQTTMDNATNATLTTGAGNMTGANMTQSGNISGCGTECF
jgi:hypothetical protein